MELNGGQRWKQAASGLAALTTYKQGPRPCWDPPKQRAEPRAKGSEQPGGSQQLWGSRAAAPRGALSRGIHPLAAQCLPTQVTHSYP